ncbi:hypothetical protein ACP26L_27585 [Paenibacillus sp. S-38]|uniref:hypothetical protein n=1 Tax=Paenibacillus sp. S-38 TaxID=3416710 RepID=UPI003CF69ACB
MEEAYDKNGENAVHRTGGVVLLGIAAAAALLGLGKSLEAPARSASPDLAAGTSPAHGQTAVPGEGTALWEPAATGHKAVPLAPAVSGQEAASSDAAASGPEAPVSGRADTPAAAGTIVGEGRADADGDGRMDTIRIQVTAAVEQTDLNPGPFEGTYLYGTFEAVAAGADGRELGRFPLNGAFDGGEMSFRKEEPFRLLFDDYNADRQPDFTVGQWGGSNGNFYSLLTVGREGFGVLAEDIYSADHDESIRYPKAGETAFLNVYYDQAEGAYMEVTRRWKDGAFAAGPPVPTKDSGSAGVEAQAHP